MKDQTTFRCKSSQCPHCRKQLDAATLVTSVGGKAPKTGDFTVCLYCAEVLRWRSGGHLTLLSEKERAHVAASDPLTFFLLLQVQNAAAMRIVRGRKKRVRESKAEQC